MLQKNIRFLSNYFHRCIYVLLEVRPNSSSSYIQCNNKTLKIIYVSPLYYQILPPHFHCYFPQYLAILSQSESCKNCPASSQIPWGSIPVFQSPSLIGQDQIWRVNHWHQALSHPQDRFEPKSDLLTLIGRGFWMFLECGGAESARTF